MDFFESVPKNALAPYLLFGAFSFYQKLHLKNFRGSSEKFRSALLASSVLCTCVGLFYLYSLWSYFDWRMPALFFAASILSIIPFFIIEKLIHPEVISVVGFLGWPLCAWFMFAAISSQSASSYLSTGDAFVADSKPALTFRGMPCTKDCSGHRAGYRWAEQNDISDEGECLGNSPSFKNGCLAYVEEQQEMTGGEARESE